MKRTAVRLLFLAVLIAAPFAPISPRIGVFLMRFDPLLAAVSLVGGKVAMAFSFGGLTVMIASLFVRRFYCRWLCPMGLSQEGVSKCGKKIPSFSFLSIKKKKSLRSLRIWGPILLLATFLAAFAGGFGFLWLGGTAIFCSVLSGRPAMFSASMFVGILLASLFVPKFWCRIGCPSGALSDMLFYFALPLRKLSRRKTLPSGASGVDRRRFLHGLGKYGVVLAVGFALFVGTKRLAAQLAWPFRPPGALDESRFLARCARCGACVRACPTAVMTAENANPMTLATPKMDFSLGWCQIDCRACAEACPTGAIALLPIKKRNTVKIASVRLDLEGCRLWHEGECSICLRECPFDAVRFVWNEKEYLNLPEIDSAKCSGCGRCVFLCPGVDGRKGLFAERLGAQKV